MRMLKFVTVLTCAALLSSCFGGSDAGTDLSTEEQVTVEPTTNVVEPVQAVPDDSEIAGAADDAVAPLPTAVTLPATPVPPTPTPDRSKPITYVVQSGDVLGLIAESFDVDIAELRSANGLSGNLINVGESLTIPALDGSTSDDDGQTATSANPTSVPNTPVPAAPVSCGNSSGHCVQSGDTLLGIANQYNVSLETLRSINPSIFGDSISIGSVVNLPGAGPSTPATSPTSTGTSTGITPIVVNPTTNDECSQQNPEFPYFHEGKCYANPVLPGDGPTAVPTPTVDETTECPDNYVLWVDGLCYPYTEPTQTPTATATVTGSSSNNNGGGPDYGTAPCRAGYFELNNGRCYPDAGTTPSTVTPTPVA